MEAMNRYIVLLLMLMLGGTYQDSKAQSPHRLLRQADQAYNAQRLGEAEEGYRKALDKEALPHVQYNLGNAVYGQERYEEAARHFEQAAQGAPNNESKSMAYHNLGNAHFQQGNFQEAAEAYKQSLRLQPGNRDTQYNLSQALRQIKMQQQQQQQQSEQQNEDPPEQESEDQQQQQSEGESEEEQNDQQDPSEGNQEGDRSEDGQEESDTREQQPSESVGRDEAEKLLEIMEQEELKVQEKMRKGKGQPPRSGKDW